MFRRRDINTATLTDDGVHYNQSNTSASVYQIIYNGVEAQIIQAGYGNTITTLELDFPNANFILGQGYQEDVEVGAYP